MRPTSADERSLRAARWWAPAALCALVAVQLAFELYCVIWGGPIALNSAAALTLTFYGYLFLARPVRRIPKLVLSVALSVAVAGYLLWFAFSFLTDSPLAALSCLGMFVLFAALSNLLCLAASRLVATMRRAWARPALQPVSEG